MREGEEVSMVKMMELMLSIRKEVRAGKNEITKSVKKAMTKLSGEVTAKLNSSDAKVTRVQAKLKVIKGKN